jgi:hypothetical protein
MKNKKLLVEIFITLMFFAVALYYIYQKDLRVDTNLSIYVKASRKDVLRLFINKDKPIKQKVNTYFHRINFNLPKKEIKSIRLMPGDKAGDFAIESISVKTPFKRHEWAGKVVKRVFKFREANFRKNTRMKDDALHIQSRKGAIILPLRGDVATVINDLSKEKSFFYFIALFLSLLFFYLVHSLNLKNLRIFFTPKILLNMALIFLTIISFPLLDDTFDIAKDVREHRLVENRVKAVMPGFRFDSPFFFLKRYQYYYNDHFSLRNLLIPLHNYIIIKTFGVSPIRKVAIGKNGWLYLSKENSEASEIDYYRSLVPFTPEELELWRLNLERRRDYLSHRGIHYLFVIAPNKSTIYPEFLPASIRPVDRPSRLDQLVNYLKKHSDFSILDLRAAMFAAKKERRVYSKTDSHWNRYGAFAAYTEIMKALSSFFKEAEAMDISAFDITEKDKSGGDLAIMLSQQDDIFRDRVIEVEHKKRPATKKGTPLKKQYPGVSQSVLECSTGKLPKVLMVHDSFANRFKSFLSPHFSRSIYLRDWNLNFYQDLIKKEKPKVVIDEMAERFLLEKVLSPPPHE